MPDPKVAPYGSWSSAISAAFVAAAGTGSRALPREIFFDQGAVYWLELRAAENGRYTLMRRSPNGEITSLTPPGYDIRSRVHEYGGGAYCVQEGVILFVNAADQRIYRQLSDEAPTAITPESGPATSVRFADGRISPDRQWSLWVRETHKTTGVENDLVAVPTDGSSPPIELARGYDFYAAPRFNSDGTQLAWIAWNHPQMPWDGTHLYVANFSRGALSKARIIAGSDRESIIQPSWGADGRLFFVSDRTGWWNIYAVRDDTVEGLASADLDMGAPPWVFGLQNYAPLADGRVLCIYYSEGIGRLGILNPQNRSLQPLPAPFTSYPMPRIALDLDGGAWMLAGSFEHEPGVVRVDIETGSSRVVHLPNNMRGESGMISIPEHITYPSDEGGSAHAFYYPPMNAGFTARTDERPPLIIFTHGGPTSSARTHYQPEIHFWTSRGFAVADVNYSGSTGYGRAYRDRLKGRWGELDVSDSVATARFLADKGIVDGSRLLIRGGSAGGFITLCALTFYQDFAAGASYYGVADAEALAQFTHKFEAHYLDSLIGPYPEARQLYRERSPISAVSQLRSPLILFQGLEDEVVPPAQSEMMVAALKANGVPYAYLTFEGEGHGFRKVQTIRRCLQAERYFYAQVLRMPLHEDIEPIAIENL